MTYEEDTFFIITDFMHLTNILRMFVTRGNFLDVYLIMIIIMMITRAGVCKRLCPQLTLLDSNTCP